MKNLHVILFLCVASASAKRPGPGPCPPGVPLVNCFVAPCQVNSCPNYPSATCVDYYCGGCIARFYLGSVEVTSQCNSGGGGATY